MKKFGRPLSELIAKNSKEVLYPEFVEQFIEYLIKKGLEIPDIFTKKAGNFKVFSYKYKLESGQEVDISNITDPHIISNLLKNFLIELPEPLLTFEISNHLLNYANINESVIYQKLLFLPIENKYLLNKLLNLLDLILQNSNKNLITIDKLVDIFATIFIRNNEVVNLPPNNKQIVIMKLILSNPKKFITPLHDIPTYETTTWKRSNKPIPRTISSTNLLNYRSKEKNYNISSSLPNSNNLKKYYDDTELPINSSSPPIIRDIDFYEDESPDLIFMKKEGNKTPLVKAGTIDKLIERTVQEKYPDPEYIHHFLLTYRFFTTPEKVILKLLQKYHSTLEENKKTINTSELTRFKIINVLKIWLSKYPFDFEESTIIDHMKKFILIIENSDITIQTYMLNNYIEKIESGKFRDHIILNNFPKPIINFKNNTITKLVDIDPLEMARQLTLIEFNTYKEIKPKEFINLNWTKPKKHELSPNILKMIYYTNYVTSWVITEILKGETIQERVTIIEYFIQVAINCKNLNNFNGMSEIMAGLSSSAIDRLKKTWEKLSKDASRKYKELKVFVSSEKNFKFMRNILKNINLPCIPYLGMFLTDLTFIDTAYKDKIENVSFHEELINFVKFRKIAEIIQKILIFQQTSYALEEVKEIQQYFYSIHENLLEEEKAFQLSLLREPREISMNSSTTTSFSNISN